MKFSCTSCQAKYSIPDDRVENKVVRLACQKCGAEIVVRGPVSSPAVKKPPADIFGDPEEDERESGDTTRIANLSELETMRQRAIAEANAAKAAAAKPKAPPPPPPPDDNHKEWMTLVHGEQHGPFSIDEIAAQVRSGTLHEKSYVWKDGMAEWQRVSVLGPFKALFAAAPVKPPPPAAIETGDATIPEFDSRAPLNQPKKTSVQAIASLNETTPGAKVDDFDALFGPKSKDAERPAPPPLQTSTDVHKLDDEPSGPNHLGDAPPSAAIEDEKPSSVRAPTRMFMRQAGLDERQRNQRLLMLAGAVVLALVLIFALLAVFDVIELPGLGVAYDLVGNGSASAPASQPAVVVSEEDKKRIREQLMGKNKPEVKEITPAPTGSSKPEPPPPPPPTPTPVKPEETLQEGLKAEQITQVVSARAGAVKSCYERELKRGTQVRGKLVVSFSIANTGNVSQAAVTTAELKDGELAKCVVSAVKAWKFPRFSGDTVSVEYPFLLSPSE